MENIHINMMKSPHYDFRKVVFRNINTKYINNETYLLMSTFYNISIKKGRLHVNMAVQNHYKKSISE